jgi:hypothetical protein
MTEAIHIYLSTACVHGFHEKCNKVCKFGQQPELCICPKHADESALCYGIEHPLGAAQVAAPMTKTLASLLCLAIAAVSSAQRVEPCPSNSCTPPLVFTSTKSGAPLDAPTKFGSIIKRAGVPQWQWIRTGNPSRPCTEKERSTPQLKYGCEAEVGDVLIETPQFRFVAAAPSRSALASLEAVSPQPSPFPALDAYLVTDHPGFAIPDASRWVVYARPRYEFVAIRVPRAVLPDDRCLLLTYSREQAFGACYYRKPFAVIGTDWMVVPVPMRGLPGSSEQWVSARRVDGWDGWESRYLLRPARLGELPTMEYGELREAR